MVLKRRNRLWDRVTLPEVDIGCAFKVTRGQAGCTRDPKGFKFLTAHRSFNSLGSIYKLNRMDTIFRSLFLKNTPPKISHKQEITKEEQKPSEAFPFIGNSKGKDGMQFQLAPLRAVDIWCKSNQSNLNNQPESLLIIA